MSFKIRISYHNMYKVLDYISDYTFAKDGFVVMDNSFFSGLLPMNKVKVIQTLNALESEGVIEKFPPSIQSPFPCLRLTNAAFTYRLHTKRDRFRFWLPTAISIGAVVVAVIALIL